MNVLVTGGTTFVGSHLVKELVDDGYQITVFDYISRGARDCIETMLSMT
jgi:UDP-glucose 4-epimerase